MNIREARIESVKEAIWKELPYVRAEDAEALAIVYVDALSVEPPTLPFVPADPAVCTCVDPFSNCPSHG
jgi:hypothetical protein